MNLTFISDDVLISGTESIFLNPGESFKLNLTVTYCKGPGSAKYVRVTGFRLFDRHFEVIENLTGQKGEKIVETIAKKDRPYLVLVFAIE